jgi:D-serine deaminase-like pyridoxal phosphate-dependent protein
VTGPALLDWRHKGFWLPDGGDPIGQSIMDGPFTWPLLVARESAIRHNIATMAGYLRERGVLHAPHGKTTMAPTLFAAQLAAGAWGLTAATANQTLAYRRFGVPRILLANELLDPRPLRWLAGELAADPDFTLLSYVDSRAGVEALADAAGDRPFQILVELGFPGGRTGCRTVAAAVEVARAAVAAGLEVAGVAAYEGGLSTVDEVAHFLGQVRQAALSLADLATGRFVVTAGGSAYFDLVVERLRGDWDLIVRSGAYIAHDDGIYRDRTPFRRDPTAGALRPALELWAQVLSVPEPGLAIVGMGKRDAPYDEGLPVPQGIVGEVTGLNDQLGYLAADGLRPGDLVRFGISHPCSAFDRWPAIPLVDDEHRVVDVLRTYF